MNDSDLRRGGKAEKALFDKICKKSVQSIPAADVRPVMRGHWITEEEAEKIGDYSKRDTCSVCGHCDWDCTESAYFNFCPNCGADMR